MRSRYFVFTVVIGFMLAGAVYAQAPRAAAPRPAWEYKTLRLEVDGPNFALYEDGKLTPGSMTPINRAPELGAEGWELVSVSPMPTAFLESVSATGSKTTFATKITYIFWFKRPK